MDISDTDITVFQDAISEYSSYDFRGYSKNSLRRRLDKVLKENRMEIRSLIGKMKKEADFLEKVMKQITVNTTELFRDPHVWRKFLSQILPKYKTLSSINIWHPGSSTGQEVYSMMMLLDHLDMLDKSNIYASDINSDVLDTAAAGTYKYRFNKEYIDNFYEVFPNENDSRKAEDRNEHRKYFTVDKTRDSIVMSEDLKKKVIYKTNDLVTIGNPFPVKFDIIICRNVIIYFNYELQNRVLKMFHDNMNEMACLLLGLHESIIGPYSNIFMKDEQFYFKRRRPEDHF